MIHSIDGPLISVSDFTSHLRLFVEVFGMTDLGGGDLDEAAVRQIWGVKGRRAETRLLMTPGSGAGVLLVRFDPVSPIAIREGTGSTDSGALKVIDFAAPDFEAATAALERAGFPFSAPPAEYSVPGGGRFTEGHLKGPDGITCAVLAFHDDPLSRFVRITDRTFSEIVGVSAPVDDLDEVRRFYDAIGVGVVYEYSIGDESFGAMIGKQQASIVRGVNYGLSEQDPMLGIIHYGLPAGVTRSLKERAVLPNRGLAAIRCTVLSVDDVAAACERQQLRLLAPAAEVELPPYGRVRSVVVQAPHGVIHHFLELKQRG